MPNDPKERAQKLFNLVDPVDSPEWDEYIKVRDQGEWISTEFMCKEADEPDTYYRDLHSLAWKSISRALPDDKDLARRFADSIDVRAGLETKGIQWYGNRPIARVRPYR